MNILDIVFASKLGKKGYLKLNNNTDRLLARHLYNKSSGHIEITTDTAPYVYRATPVQNAFKAKMHKIVGASVVWNQIIENRQSFGALNCTATYDSDTHIFSITQTSNNAYTGLYTQPSKRMPQNHVCCILLTVKASQNVQLSYGLEGKSKYTNLIANTETFIKYIGKDENQIRNSVFYFYTNAISDLTADLKINVIDLTAMFGTTVADYVYLLEQSEVGKGIAWLQSYGFFTEDYYAYKQNKLESGCVSAHKTYDGETLLTNTELSPITLRGLFKLSTDKLTVDGDEYNADESVTRKYGESDLGNDLEWSFYNQSSYPTFYRADISDKADGKVEMLLTANYTYTTTWATARDNSGYYFLDNAEGRTKRIYINDSNYATVQAFTNALKGQKVIYPLATPTTEQTTPFTETEIVGSTEEFIDYEVAQGNRDVAIPVGTETDYYVKVKN